MEEVLLHLLLLPEHIKRCTFIFLHGFFYLVVIVKLVGVRFLLDVFQIKGKSKGRVRPLGLDVSEMKEVKITTLNLFLLTHTFFLVRNSVHCPYRQGTIPYLQTLRYCVWVKMPLLLLLRNAGIPLIAR